MFTYYRVKATGQWCGPSYENGGAVPDAIAETLGLSAGAIEAVEVESGDPRTGELLSEPEPEPQPAPPDAPAFKLAVFADPPIGLGKTRARLFARDYPDGLQSLDAGNWALARESVADALANTEPSLITLTQTEHGVILALMAAFHIPEA